MAVCIRVLELTHHDLFLSLLPLLWTRLSVGIPEIPEVYRENTDINVRRWGTNLYSGPSLQVASQGLSTGRLSFCSTQHGTGTEKNGLVMAGRKAYPARGRVDSAFSLRTHTSLSSLVASPCWCLKPDSHSLS